jgi:hypothetical protein
LVADAVLADASLVPDPPDPVDPDEPSAPPPVLGAADASASDDVGAPSGCEGGVGVAAAPSVGGGEPDAAEGVPVVFSGFASAPDVAPAAG